MIGALASNTCIPAYGGTASVGGRRLRTPRLDPIVSREMGIGRGRAYVGDREPSDPLASPVRAALDVVRPETRYQRVDVRGRPQPDWAARALHDLQGAGNYLVNNLFGNTGNNLLNGGTGADTMYGGIGNDTYFVDNGLDQVVENAGEGIDAVFSSAHLVMSANVETLVLQGGANANGAGNALANAIFGDSSDNMLDGQGNADMLTGNAGNDTFVFIIGQGNGDTVVDFAGNGAAAGDSLRFVGYGVGATFTNIDAAHWQVNYNGGASHDIITFMNGAPVHATDFVFV